MKQHLSRIAIFLLRKLIAQGVTKRCHLSWAATAQREGGVVEGRRMLTFKDRLKIRNETGFHFCLHFVAFLVSSSISIPLKLRYLLLSWTLPVGVDSGHLFVPQLLVLPCSFWTQGHFF
jgi:hypothetical protein